MLRTPEKNDLKPRTPTRKRSLDLEGVAVSDSKMSRVIEGPVTQAFILEALKMQSEEQKKWFKAELDAVKATVHNHKTELATHSTKLVEHETELTRHTAWIQDIEERIAGNEAGDSGDGGQTVRDLRRQLDEQNKKYEELKKEQSTMFVRFRKEKQRTEDEKRAKNIIIHGLPKIHEDGVKSAQMFLSGKLHIEPPISTAYWMNGRNGPRLMVKLCTEQDKWRVFRNCGQLKGSRISVQEDVCEDTGADRRRQRPTFDWLRQQGLKPQFRGPVLYVEGKQYKGPMHPVHPGFEYKDGRSNEGSREDGTEKKDEGGEEGTTNMERN